jgi:hypothetical protein
MRSFAPAFRGPALLFGGWCGAAPIHFDESPDPNSFVPLRRGG